MELLFYPHYTWSRLGRSQCIWKNQKYLHHVRSFQNGWKLWDIWTFFHFYRNHCIHGYNYFTLCTYGRIWDALGVYEKIKNIDTMYNHFKLVEKYGMIGHYFISIENIVSHEIIILPHCIVSRLWRSYCIWINWNYWGHENSFKSWERYGIFERSFISMEINGSHGIIILPWLHMVAQRALLLYMKKKSKISRSCTIISKVEKSTVYLNVLSFP